MYVAGVFFCDFCKCLFWILEKNWNSFFLSDYKNRLDPCRIPITSWSHTHFVFWAKIWFFSHSSHILKIWKCHCIGTHFLKKRKPTHFIGFNQHTCLETVETFTWILSLKVVSSTLLGFKFWLHFFEVTLNSSVDFMKRLETKQIKNVPKEWEKRQPLKFSHWASFLCF